MDVVGVAFPRYSFVGGCTLCYDGITSIAMSQYAGYRQFRTATQSVYKAPLSAVIRPPL